MFRVGEGNQHAIAATQQMRQSSGKSEANSHRQTVDAASTAVNADYSTTSGTLTAAEKNVTKVITSNDVAEKEVEYSCSLKVDSSFVADSLAPDVSQRRAADAVVLNESGLAQQTPGKSGEVDMHCQSHTSHVLKLTTQQPSASASVVPEHEQTSRQDNVTPVLSSRSTHSSNVVSMLQTVFTVAAVHFMLQFILMSSASPTHLLYVCCRSMYACALYYGN